jgi:hypothetical protein
MHSPVAEAAAAAAVVHSSAAEVVPMTDLGTDSQVQRVDIFALLESRKVASVAVPARDTVVQSRRVRGTPAVAAAAARSRIPPVSDPPTVDSRDCQAPIHELQYCVQLASLRHIPPWLPLHYPCPFPAAKNRSVILAAEPNTR